MKFLSISLCLSLAFTQVLGDVQYSVVAFPADNQGVGVSVGGQVVALQKGSVPNLYTGSAPYGANYQYVLTGATNTAETAQRQLAQGTTSTGNEFFNRTKTVYDVPGLPQAYNPFFPTLMTNMNKSNEVATLIMNVNATQLDAFNKDPMAKLDAAQVTTMTYISNKEVYTFQNAGISTSGQSTKDFAKQSWAIELDKYNSKNTTKSLLFGRTTLKLRAEETDATFAREKLVLDMLAASGAATLSASWTRVFINNEPYGLFLLMDDASTHFIDNVLHGGNWKYANTGATFKGNALSETQEGNLVYVGDDMSLYSNDLYKLQDKGEDNAIAKNNSNQLIVDFTKRLSQVNPQDATDAQHPGSIDQLIENPQNTLVHMAMNFLIGSWDGFWYQASNYYLNQDLGTKKWTLITYDFDETYGNGAPEGINTVSYQNYSRPGSKRPLVNAYLSNAYYTSQFESILKTLVKRFFKPSVVTPRLQAWSEMLKEEIAWTRSIAGKSQGTATTMTVADFQNGLLGATGSIDQWVTQRAKALTQQLNFVDTDDLPALAAYTEGSHLDTNGNVVSNNGTTITTSSGSTDASSSKPTSAASVLSFNLGTTVLVSLALLYHM
ncbi:coth protein-domain-containing protein [Sporodiniella umbellata]|nr:coth protein-domain-containing protein [Sporodiniella umbellata]